MCTNPEPLILTGVSGGSFALTSSDGEFQECPELDPTSTLLRSDGEKMTPSHVANVLDMLMIASEIMNASVLGPTYLPGIGTIQLANPGPGKSYVPRVNPVNAKVFGAYVVSEFTHTGVMAAAREGHAYLTSNTGSYPT